MRRARVNAPAVAEGEVKAGATVGVKFFGSGRRDSYCYKKGGFLLKKA